MMQEFAAWLGKARAMVTMACVFESRPRLHRFLHHELFWASLPLWTEISRFPCQLIVPHRLLSPNTEDLRKCFGRIGIGIPKKVPKGLTHSYLVFKGLQWRGMESTRHLIAIYSADGRPKSCFTQWLVDMLFVLLLALIKSNEATQSKSKWKRGGTCMNKTWTMETHAE